MNLDKYSNPIRIVYSQCTDLLIENIARHFNVSAMGNTPSFEWQATKLAELGQLTKENTAIIAKIVGDTSGMTEEALKTALLDAIQTVDPALLAAAQKGLLTELPAAQITTKMQNILSAYSAQAAEQFNLVNTVMLRSSENQFRRIIVNTVALETNSLYTATVQQILNTQTGAVVTGISSRQAALRASIKQMANDGITGFIDASGREWSPEAYVNMDIRTTSGKVAQEATVQRNQEYGNDLMIIPVNAMARPKCAPYQGWVVSMGGSSGTTEDRYGNKITYHSINETSYGQPDGIGGINCHHIPFAPFIPGMSKTLDEPAPNVHERYLETQKQRKMEVSVRDAKREAIAAKASNDNEAFQAAQAKVKQRTATMKQYASDSGLTVRTDRTQVYGYDRSIARTKSL